MKSAEPIERLGCEGCRCGSRPEVAGDYAAATLHSLTLIELHERSAVSAAPALPPDNRAGNGS